MRGELASNLPHHGNNCLSVRACVRACHSPAAVNSFAGSDIICFSEGTRCFSRFVGSVLSSDAGVDCDPSINDGMLDDSPR